MRHLLDISNFSVEELALLFEKAEDIDKNPKDYAHRCEGLKLATLFFEPSTRTRLSFESAMYELGGQVIGFASASSSSTAKGESVCDTISVVSRFADIIAMRHPLAGAPLAAIQTSLVPIINAGDGEHQHPTQTLADLMTINREKGRLDGLTIGVCGDLKYGRTVHSLIEAMVRYKDNKFILISPNELKLPNYIKLTLEKSGLEWHESTSLQASIPELDILYMTRVQEERFTNRAEYERLKDVYILTPEKLEYAKPNLSIMHPLPRVGEISVKIDSDPRACYFKQVENGKLIRMALILKLLDEKEKTFSYIAKGALYNKSKCSNEKCISSLQGELDEIFIPVDISNTMYRCAYCDKSLTVI